jgi:hypothetical protein
MRPFFAVSSAACRAVSALSARSCRPVPALSFRAHATALFPAWSTKRAAFSSRWKRDQAGECFCRQCCNSASRCSAFIPISRDGPENAAASVTESFCTIAALTAASLSSVDMPRRTAATARSMAMSLALVAVAGVHSLLVEIRSISLARALRALSRRRPMLSATVSLSFFDLSARCEGASDGSAAVALTASVSCSAMILAWANSARADCSAVSGTRCPVASRSNSIPLSVSDSGGLIASVIF